MSVYPKETLQELEAWVRASHAGWWRSWGEAGNGDLSVHVAAMCRALSEYVRPGDCRLRMAALDRLINRLPGPRAALALYLSALHCFGGETPATRVLLEDLAEALMIPPTLLRRLTRDLEEPRQVYARSA